MVNRIVIKEASLYNHAEDMKSPTVSAFGMIIYHSMSTYTSKKTQSISFLSRLLIEPAFIPSLIFLPRHADVSPIVEHEFGNVQFVCHWVYPIHNTHQINVPEMKPYILSRNKLRVALG